MSIHVIDVFVAHNLQGVLLISGDDEMVGGSCFLLVACGPHPINQIKVSGVQGGDEARFFTV